ncbi:MAG: glutaminyl-peptide cyclotransferase [Solirubrobacteraceae bacterium]|nr:glutaminyl-peptide cyclotransferase [Solirubrobacteraceae bacterium]
MLLPLLAVTAIVAVALAHSGGPDARSAAQPAVPAARPGGFDARRAYTLAARQVRAGQRPAGSPQLRKLADQLRPLLPGGRFEPVPGQPGLRNVVGTLPGRRPGIVVGAHYDTLVKPAGFLGANNGAAGTAVVIELARALARVRRPADAPEVRFVLFDGEEPAAGLPEEQADFYAAGLRGSRAYVAAYPGRTKEMLLLDYVGNGGLRLPREGSSDSGLWQRLRAAAGRAGVGVVFPDRTGTTITDDHTPFLRAGVPAVDLIDWSYPGHACCDALSNLSVRSLDAVGETLLAYLRSAR